MKKTIFQLTDEELLALSEQDSMRARSILSQAIPEIKYQIDQLQRKNSDWSQKGSALLSLAALLSFLPPIADFGITYMQHFLLWTFPFLIAGLICYFFTFLSASALARQFPTAAEGEPEELVYKRAMANAIREVWQAMYEDDERKRPYVRLTFSLIFIYVFSFSLNVFLFAFLGVPGHLSGVMQFLSFLILLLAILLFLGRKTKTIHLLKDFKPKDT